ncbi:P-loop containing nucleoside triphosphate hydrolase protein [Aspergillus pseudonomiae]|uniref:P-loop containing nucleoside triphosphate hydrolase protein n=1 Tax=Aspergillus pseudonomiae TaxID=1506151 RepID=A0A5N7D2A2_9EURO|nr:P-loop containing nucleoside triphosphate hydrolase protein [Aspergillus pseudonomiae]KAE8400535.1 P-loop containing nucleoside triphosphate hydrolase protein [Aspergillus pseudonomiae]
MLTVWPITYNLLYLDSPAHCTQYCLPYLYKEPPYPLREDFSIPIIYDFLICPSLYGPPGTGKTSVSATIALHHSHTKRQLLIVCNSNQGLGVISNRTVKALQFQNDPQGADGIFRLDTEYHEEAETQFAPRIQAVSDTEFVMKIRSDLGQMGIADQQFTLLRLIIEASTTQQNGLSLGSHIIKRLEYAKWLGSGWLGTDDDEMVLLWTFLTYQEALAQRGFLFLGDVVEDPSVMANAGDSADMLATLFYLQKARVVLCTASTAGRKLLRGFWPLTVLVEKASQLTETSTVNGIARILGSVKKAVLSGEIKQLGPTVTSINADEFYDSETLPFFARLLSQGIPDIAEFSSQELYDGSLVTHPTADRHCEAFQAYVSEMTNLVLAFVKADLTAQDLMILSSYSEEIRVLKQVIHGLVKPVAIEIRSVDFSQGREAKIVVLSTTRLGGSLGIGFVADRQRQNVALTRD